MIVLSIVLATIALLCALGSLFVARIPGPRGEIGPQGLIGPNGDQGDRGPQGVPGADRIVNYWNGASVPDIVEVLSKANGHWDHFAWVRDKSPAYWDALGANKTPDEMKTYQLGIACGPSGVQQGSQFYSR